jgi:hypothetical protein
VRSRSSSDSEAGTHKAGFPRHGVTIQGTHIQCNLGSGLSNDLFMHDSGLTPTFRPARGFCWGSRDVRHLLLQSNRTAEGIKMVEICFLEPDANN